MNTSFVVDRPKIRRKHDIFRWCLLFSGALLAALLFGLSQHVRTQDVPTRTSRVLTANAASTAAVSPAPVQVRKVEMEVPAPVHPVTPSPQGIGKLRLGMTRAEAESTGELDTKPADGTSVTRGVVFEDGITILAGRTYLDSRLRHLSAIGGNAVRGIFPQGQRLALRRLIEEIWTVEPRRPSSPTAKLVTIRMDLTGEHPGQRLVYDLTQKYGKSSLYLPFEPQASVSSVCLQWSWEETDTRLLVFIAPLDDDSVDDPLAGPHEAHLYMTRGTGARLKEIEAHEKQTADNHAERQRIALKNLR